MAKRKREDDNLIESKPSQGKDAEGTCKKHQTKVKKKKRAQHGITTQVAQPQEQPKGAQPQEAQPQEEKAKKPKKEKKKKKKDKNRSKDGQRVQKPVNTSKPLKAPALPAPAPAARASAAGTTSTSGRPADGAQQQPSSSSPAEQQTVTPSPGGAAAAADLWRRRCLRFVELCSANDSSEILAHGLATWPTDDVLRLWKDCSLSLDTFGAVCYSWPAGKASAVLGRMKANEVAKVRAARTACTRAGCLVQRRAVLVHGHGHECRGPDCRPVWAVAARRRACCSSGQAGRQLCIPRA